MTCRVHKSAEARRDLVDIFEYLARESVATADRFLQQVDSTLNRLSESPGIGARYLTDEPELAELRCAQVSRFKNHLIFYRADSGELLVVRVLHAARDLDALLAADPTSE